LKATESSSTQKRLYFLFPAQVQGTLNLFDTILALFAVLLWKYLVDLLEFLGWIERIYLLVTNPI
jgi:hypothetical protein